MSEHLPVVSPGSSEAEINEAMAIVFQLRDDRGRVFDVLTWDVDEIGLEKHFIQVNATLRPRIKQNK